MAKLQQFRDYHFSASQKVSDNTRTLALSAIALVWMLKSGDSSHYQIPEALAFPLLLVIGALALDFAQYLCGTVIWHYIFRREECKLHAGQITESDELYVSAFANFVQYSFFYTKAFLVVIAYWKLLQYFLSITNIT